MSLRTKTLLVAGAITLSLLVLIYAITQTVFLGGFVSLEAANVQENVERVVNALSDELVSMSSTAADWGHWDDTYTFVRGTNDGYIDANISDETLVNLELNFMIFTDTQGQVILSKGVDLQAETEASLSESLVLEIAASPLLHDMASEEDSVTGILQTPAGAALIASRPILNSQGDGPAAGILVIGRYLNDDKLQRLSESLRLHIKLHSFSGDHISKDLSDSDMEAALSAISVQTVDEGTVTGYSV